MFNVLLIKSTNRVLFRLAIVVGNLQSRQIGPRSHVWAEPDVLDKAAYEFAEVTNSSSIFIVSSLYS